MEYTTNYHLPTWAKEDRIMMDDFNDLTEKLEAALVKKGNCKIIASYRRGTGNCGASNPCIFEFLGEPTVVLLANRNDGRFMLLVEGESLGYSFGGTTPSQVHVTWDVKYEDGILSYPVTWYADTPEAQMNKQGDPYSVIALVEIH